MKLKMVGGTTNSSQQALCITCGAATILRGVNNQQIIHCQVLRKRIEFPVVECNQYHHANETSLWDMQQIAWNLITDKKGKSIGFKSPSETRKLVRDEKIEELGDVN